MSLEQVMLSFRKGTNEFPSFRISSESNHGCILNYDDGSTLIDVGLKST